MEQLEPRLLMTHTLIIGHRGTKGTEPENTLLSMRTAFNSGADVVESDIHVTVDGHIVLMHDETVDRTTDGTGLVYEKTLSELKTLDAGSWFSADAAGEPIPSLEEALETARGRGIVYLDLKSDGMGARIRQVLDELDVPDTAIWTSANFEYLAADIHQYMPGTCVMWWGPVPSRPDTAYFEHMRSIGVGGFDLRWGEFSKKFAKAAQDNGFIFSTWVIDEPKEWRGALKMHVDAMETNYPGALAAALDGQPDNATVEVVGDTLMVRGDAQDNWVRIEGGEDGDSIRVRGIHGTLLNGQTDSLEYSGIHRLQISLDRGNDTVEIFDVVLEEGLSIDGGVGNDDAVIERSCLSGDSSALLAAGTDRLVLRDSNFSSLSADGGSGNDAIDAGLNGSAANSGNTITDPSFLAWERRIS